MKTRYTTDNILTDEDLGKWLDNNNIGYKKIKPLTGYHGIDFEIRKKEDEILLELKFQCCTILLADRIERRVVNINNDPEFLNKL